MTSTVTDLRPQMEELYLRATSPYEQWIARWEERRVDEGRYELALLRQLRAARERLGSTAALIRAGRAVWAQGDIKKARATLARVLRGRLETPELSVGLVVARAIRSAALTTGALRKVDLREVHAQLSGELEAETARYLEGSLAGYSGDVAGVIVRATDPAHPLPMPELSKKLENDFLGISAKRAKVIARTESARAYGKATYETYKELGGKRYRWLTAAGSPAAVVSPVCVYCQNLAAQGMAALEDGFSGSLMVGVRDPHPVNVEAKHPPYHPNCRCDIAMDTEGWLPPAEGVQDIEEPLEFTTPATRKKFMEEQTEFIKYSRPVSQETRVAAVDYSQNSRFWNRYLRADDFGSLGRKGYNPASVLEMDEFLANTALKQDIVVWRGGAVPGLGADSAVGLEFTDLGYTATTLERQVAKGFIDQADEVMIKLVLREGQPASPVGFLIRGGGFTGEFEVVLPRGLTYRVVADEVVAGVRQLTIEAMGKAAEVFTGHTIRAAQIDAWLADSVNKKATVHMTKDKAFKSILESGVRVAKTNPHSAWGRGFYTSTAEEGGLGAKRLDVAIKLKNPLRGKGFAMDDLDRIMREAFANQRATGVEVIEYLKGLGYDGIIIDMGGGEQWIIAFSDDAVKVIV